MSDNKKDNKGISQKDTDTFLQSKFSVFLNNEHKKFVVLKTEKLASALYVVTGFVSETDPLRTQLRTCAIELVSSATSPKTTAPQQHVSFSSRCLEIGSLLSMAERAGVVSPMNARVLCEEYASLAAFVEGHSEKVFGEGTLDTHAVVANHTHALPSSAQRQVSSPSQRTVVKRTNNNKRHNSRRDSILSLFNKKDKITVKDASSSIEGCSEKTIQRELLALVAEGVLLKEGERRWSTYRKVP